MQATLPHQALPHDALLPRPPGGNGAGVALSVLAHAGLAVALTVSVDWRTHTPEVVSAELWSSVPQMAAPRAVEPPPPAPVPTPPPAPAPAPPPVQAAPPPPREADIATEREQRRKLEAERQRAEAERDALKKRQLQAEADAKKRAQAEEAARQAKAKDEEERVARQREENLRRMMSQAGATTPPGTGATSTTGGTGTAAQDSAPSANYAGRIVAAVRRHIVFTGAINDDTSAEVEVRAAPGGSIISARLLKSSGHKEWDDAVLRALDKAGRLPTDTDGRVPARLILVFRPRE